MRVDRISASFPDFGVSVDDLDLAALSDDQFAQLRNLVHTESVVVVRSQQHLSPRQQFELTLRFDPAAPQIYGHGNDARHQRSILHPDLKTVPSQPQVQVLGHGFVAGDYLGLSNVQLKHPHHATFHKTRVPLEEDESITRFYRWHIDAAFYAMLPPVVTTLMAVQVPGLDPTRQKQTRFQTVRWDDGSGDELPNVPLGATAFVSGRRMLRELSPEDRELALSASVEYAPHPYVWMSRARSNSVGLGLETEGLELEEEEQLPPVDPAQIQTYPMCWKNAVTGEYALQVHPSCARRIILPDRVISDLQQVRELLWRLQRPAVRPDSVLCADWREGDFCIFDNRQVLHTVLGSFRPGDVRVFRQCNLAASVPPEGPPVAAGPQ